MLRKNGNQQGQQQQQPKGIRLKAQAQRKPQKAQPANVPKPGQGKTVGQTLGQRPHTVLQKATKPTGQALPGVNAKKGHLKSSPKPASKEQHRALRRGRNEPQEPQFNGEVERAKVISNLIYQRFGAQQTMAGAEVGVWKAETSAYLLEHHGALSMICIDPWCVDTTYKDGPGSRMRSQAEWDQIYSKAINKLGVFGNRVTVIRKKSDQAAQHVPDKSLDFVFIDANHNEENVKLDIQTWLPKVKSGGYLIGHDFNLDSVKNVALSMFKRIEGGQADLDFVWWIEVQ